MKRKNLYGKNVFVTGASSGIGQACAVMFAKNGCDVIGVSRNTEETAEVFPGGGSLTLKRLDVTDEKAGREFIEKLPGVDIAIMCAGMGVAGPAETTASELTRRQMEVNYFGTLNVAQPCLSRMREQGRGLLIVIGSIAGRVSIPMQSQYSASKYALEAFTDAVRMEMKQYGVRACIIEPGDTKTGFTDARVMPDKAKEASKDVDIDAAKEASKDVDIDAAKEASKDIDSDAVKEASKDVVSDTEKDASTDATGDTTTTVVDATGNISTTAADATGNTSDATGNTTGDISSDANTAASINAAEKVVKASSVYDAILEKSIAKMAADEQNGRSPKSVARVALSLAGKKNPPARVPVGIDYKALMMLLRIMPDRTKEYILSKLYLPEE